MTRTVVLRWMASPCLVSSAVPSVVLRDDPEGVVLFQPTGSDHVTATGQRVGPRGRIMLPGGWDGGHATRTWTGDGVVRIHRTGDPWSVWRWVDVTTAAWSPYVYVNLEEPWLRTPIGFDTHDWVLDVIIGDDGTIVRKDEDELAWSLESGGLSVSFHERIRGAADAAIAAHGAGAWPFGIDWSELDLPGTDAPLRLDIANATRDVR